MRCVLHRRKTKKRVPGRPKLRIYEILAWADAHHARTGQWPQTVSGEIADSPNETWHNMNACLCGGWRGLRPGSSLARLLAKHRGVRYHMILPHLTVEQILAWADAHHARTGEWPNAKAGPIPDSGGQTWCAVAVALQKGRRGLSPGTTLARFLTEHRGKRNIKALPPLTVARILEWADAHQRRTSRRPTVDSGGIPEAPGENWMGVDRALTKSARGLNTALTLAQFLDHHRGKRPRRTPVTVIRPPRPPLRVSDILAWADAHYRRTGHWPKRTSGEIAESPSNNWSMVSAALTGGLRGLPGGSSLTLFLARHRGARNHLALPHLNTEQILAWADAHQQRTGKWPTANSGPIVAAPGEKWSSIDTALQHGLRGLAAGSSLARLLAEQRGRRNKAVLPRLTIPNILAWADDHHRRTGEWPDRRSGAIPQATGDTWACVGKALTAGRRGLPGGSSLARLLFRQYGRRNRSAPPPLSYPQILAWADAHRQRTGQWPHEHSGSIAGAAGENWRAVNESLSVGRRGLPAGSSLVRLLLQHRGSPSRPMAERFVARPPRASRFTISQILLWADAHQRRTGQWPTAKSGPVKETPGDTWARIADALVGGYRGLKGGDSLARLLVRYRDVRRAACRPRLSPQKILRCADAYHQRTGKWPVRGSGPIPESPGDTWRVVHAALALGTRGLPPGGNFAQMIFDARGEWNGGMRPRLSAAKILVWADAHRRRTGHYPLQTSGLIPESPGEEWRTVDIALRRGQRGLPGKQTLAKFLAAHGRADVAGAVRPMERPAPARTPYGRLAAPVRRPRPGRGR